MIEKPIALIVEDDPNQADIFTTALQHVDFETVTIHDGQQALDWLASSIPHLVILDLNLPQVTGDKILAFIRQDERLTGARVIIATANPRMADPLQDESDIMLVKPISFTQLRDLAERIKQTL
jgi:DNA-binding response OmpR family regulator